MIIGELCNEKQHLNYKFNIPREIEALDLANIQHPLWYQDYEMAYLNLRLKPIIRPNYTMSQLNKSFIKSELFLKEPNQSNGSFSTKRKCVERTLDNIKGLLIKKALEKAIQTGCSVQLMYKYKPLIPELKDLQLSTSKTSSISQQRENIRSTTILWHTAIGGNI